MEDSSKEILARLRVIDEKLLHKETRYRRLLRLTEILVIPVMLGVLAFVTSQASNRISASHLELAEQQSKAREDEFNAALQAKYLELFHRDISSGKPGVQRSTLGLLRIMRPELASLMTSRVLADSTVEESVKKDPILTEIASKLYGDVRYHVKWAINFDANANTKYHSYKQRMSKYDALMEAQKHNPAAQESIRCLSREQIEQFIEDFGG